MTPPQIPSNGILPASFRDPNGFLFRHEGILYRQINQSYRDNYLRLIESGLYDRLTGDQKLIPHQEAAVSPPAPETAYKIIRPEELTLITYPYEWSFSQLKDAARLTLSIQKQALKAGLSLKDSSAYNIQYLLESGKPILIDTLSFEIYPEGSPWVAYRQFCQHFLAPLALMAYTDIRLNQLLRIYIDGVPLDLASQLLPRRTRFNFGLLSHIHLHAAAQKRYSGADVRQAAGTRSMSKTNLLGLIDNLERTIQKLTWQPSGTEWGDYYQDTNYTDQALEEKKALVANLIQEVGPKMVWDLGANTGLFSRLASREGIPTVSFDVDPAAVEKNYLDLKDRRDKNLLPLALDLTNPSPAIGWNNNERESLSQRAAPDLVIALALIHHLAISNNLPFEQIAAYFSSLAPWLVIEFVPKPDSQVQRLLASRQDIFPRYTPEGFEAAFGRYYHLQSSHSIAGSQRCLYLMKRREN